jgi:hypothetical protein
MKSLPWTLQDQTTFMPFRFRWRLLPNSSSRGTACPPKKFETASTVLRFKRMPKNLRTFALWSRLTWTQARAVTKDFYGKVEAHGKALKTNARKLDKLRLTVIFPLRHGLALHTCRLFDLSRRLNLANLRQLVIAVGTAVCRLPPHGPDERYSASVLISMSGGEASVRKGMERTRWRKSAQSQYRGASN